MQSMVLLGLSFLGSSPDVQLTSNGRYIEWSKIRTFILKLLTKELTHDDLAASSSFSWTSFNFFRALYRLQIVET